MEIVHFMRKKVLVISLLENFALVDVLIMYLQILVRLDKVDVIFSLGGWIPDVKTDDLNVFYTRWLKLTQLITTMLTNYHLVRFFNTI